MVWPHRENIRGVCMLGDGYNNIGYAIDTGWENHLWIVFFLL